MNIGMRAHDVAAGNITELAEKLEKLAIRDIQFAILKSLPDLNLQPGAFSPGLSRYLKQELDARKVHICVLGCYINPIHPDPAAREEHLARFREHIRFAKYLGADMIGTEMGSVRADFGFDPENHSEKSYEDLVSVFRPLVEYAADLGVMVGVEGVWCYVINTPKKMKRFLDDIAMPNLSVIFDPVNYLTIDNYQNQTAMLEEAFELFGDRIAAVHLKDFAVENGSLCLRLPTEGMLDYKTLFSLIRKKPHLNLLMEGVKEADVIRVRENLIRLDESIR